MNIKEKTFNEKMDRFIEGYTKENQISGSLRVTVKDRIIYERFIGYADADAKTPINKDSVFTLYSLSKPFCTLGLLKLKDKNLVDLDKHPGEYVPEARGFDERVTVRHLLHHISGLPDYVQNAKFQERYETGLAAQMREHTKELTKYPMVFEPGTGAMYANVNFVLCALIIENVTGMGYAEYMKQEVFQPLWMYHAQIDRSDLVLSNRVKGHELQDGKVVCVDRTLDWLYGAGDVIATVQDVYSLNWAVTRKLLLKPETWDELLTPSPLSGMGMGCTISNWHGRKRITHNGGHKGFRTLHIHLPEEEFDIIFLSNSGWGEARNAYAEAVYEAYYGADEAESDKIEMDKGYIQ